MRMTARFIKNFASDLFGLLVFLSLVARSASADDASILLSAPQFPPYQWFASTDPKNQNADYVLLKPGATRRVPLAKGVLLRLWSTGFEPENIEIYLQNGARTELLKNGKAGLGNYYKKAFTFYPNESTPAAVRDLKAGAAIVVVNKSKNENKWFYQAAVRPSGKVPVIAASKNKLPVIEKVDWNTLDKSLTEAARRGIKLLAIPENRGPYQLLVASGSARSQKGKPIPILNVVGEGAFVGLALDIRPSPETTRRTFAFLEGNETLVADGKIYEGTGTEDFFNSAWYYPEKPFLQKYHGVTFKGSNPPRVTAYRWMIQDAVPFKKSFKFEFEHGNGSNSNDLEYRWVVFWYQKPDGKFDVVNQLKDGEPGQSTLVSGREASSGKNAIALLALVVGSILIGLVALVRRRRS